MKASLSPLPCILAPGFSNFRSDPQPLSLPLQGHEHYHQDHKAPFHTYNNNNNTQESPGTPRASSRKKRPGKMRGKEKEIRKKKYAKMRL